MNDLLFITSVVVLAVVPPIFIWHAVYEDGVLGRISLGSVSLFAWVFLLEEFFGDPWDVPIHFSLTFLSFAAFLCWHLWRFERRVLQQGGKTIAASMRGELCMAADTVRSMWRCLRRR